MYIMHFNYITVCVQISTDELWKQVCAIYVQINTGK